MQYRGLRELGERGEQTLEEYIRERTHATLSSGRLEQLAREWLFNTFYVKPGRWVISDLVRSVTRAAMLEDDGALRQRSVAAPMQSCLQALMQHRPGGTMTHLEWLRRGRSRSECFSAEPTRVRSLASECGTPTAKPRRSATATNSMGNASTRASIKARSRAMLSRVSRRRAQPVCCAHALDRLRRSDWDSRMVFAS